jgi:hypothetical protein
MRHLGPNSNKPVAYTVASVAGVVLAVCSCSVLPMFAGIYNLGAGLGPATAFLYSGPAINILAIFLTARVLGFEIGVWRAVGAIVFAFVVGLGMAGLFRREEKAKAAAAALVIDPPGVARPLWKSALLLAALMGILIFSDWFNPGDAVVHRVDGTQVAASCYGDARRGDGQVGERPRRTGGDRVVIPKDHIAEIVEASWVMDGMPPALVPRRPDGLAAI